MYSIRFYKIRRIFAVIIYMSALCLYAEQYHIRSVAYDIQGITRQYPLSKVVNIDTAKVFTSRSELDSYLNEKLIQLKNQRVLEEAFIIPSYGSENDEGIIPVDLLIKTKDTWNIIALPYPKYDSNSGFVFKIKIKDYNFFGTMRTLNGDISYKYETADTPQHNIGTSVSFDIPFKLGIADANWANSFGINYIIGKSSPNIDFSTGVSFDIPLYKIINLNFSIAQSVKYNPDYKADGDAFYLAESVNMGLPITLLKTEKWGNLLWTPSASITWNWDPFDISKSGDGINRSDLKGPDIQLKHGFGMQKIDWIGNFRRGFAYTVSQNLSYDTFFKTYTTSFSMHAEYYRAFERVGFAGRAYLFKNFGVTSEEGSRIRGVRDKNINTDSALLINIDVPIKVLQTDWVGWGLPAWTKWIDFEMQISPFADIAVGNNEAAGTQYNIKDGWYAAGFEIIGFPNKMRSIQGRISFGIDTVRFAQKAGKKIGFVDKAVNKLFNTSWRTGSWYELSIGIGLHY
ncbi:hypothetical protein H0R92_00990 [Treponema sp. OMZ 840]|uniref:hypothetical protein n=1 Tax=Treponema sp. OMZ 840 TaxID=244313 RepID=UPI003D949C30